MPLVTVEQQRVSKLPFGAGETTQPMVLPPWASEIRVVHTGSVTVQVSDFAPELAFPRAQADGPLVVFTGNDVERYDSASEAVGAADQSVEFIDPALGGVSAPTIRLVGGETWAGTYGVTVGDVINVSVIGKYPPAKNVRPGIVNGKYLVTLIPGSADAEVLPLEDQSFGFTTVSGVTTSFAFTIVTPVDWSADNWLTDFVVGVDYEAAEKRVRDTNGIKNDQIKNERSVNDLRGRQVVSSAANVLELDGAAFTSEVGFSLKRLNGLLLVADNTTVNASFTPWGPGTVTTFAQAPVTAGLTLVRAVSTTGVGTIEVVGVDDI
jgi:hypothetical protein